MAGKQRKVKLSTGFDLSKWPSARPTKIPRAVSSTALQSNETKLDFKAIGCYLGVIIGIIFLTYFITTSAQFAFNDDYLRTITSSQTNDPRFAPNLWLQSLFKPLSQPWLRLSLLLDYKSFGFEPSWYHVVNIILQMASCCYFYVLILMLARHVLPPEKQKAQPYWLAFIPSALLACHPLASESVAYITGRAGTLVACNVFLSIIFFFFAFFTPRRTYMVWGYLASLLFLTMGIWSGPEALVAPMVIVALTLLLKPKLIHWKEWFDVKGAEITLAVMILVFMPFLLLMGTSKDFSNGLGLPTPPAPIYLASQLRAIPVYYLRCVLLPFGLSVLPPHVISSGGFDAATLLGLVIVCVTVYLIYKLKDNLFASLGLCLFLFGLLPQAFLIQSEIASDRRFYLSLAGLCLVAGQYLAKKLPNKTFKSYALLAMPLIILASLTVWRNYAWLSEMKLWRSTLKTNSHSAFVHGMLALALARVHDNQTAKAEASAALKTDSDCLPAHLALAQINLLGKDYLDASKEYSKVFDLARSQHLETNILYQTQLGLAESLFELGQVKEAKTHAAGVLELDSSNMRANLIMGKCLIKLKQPRLALRYLEAGYKLDKMNYFFLEPIAEACLDTGDARLVSNAFGAARMAFKISPNDNVDRVLAQAAYEIGMPGEAQQPIGRLLQRHPDNAKFLYLKSLVDKALGHDREAKIAKARALKLNPAIESEANIVDARPRSN